MDAAVTSRAKLVRIRTARIRIYEAMDPPFLERGEPTSRQIHPSVIPPNVDDTRVAVHRSAPALHPRRQTPMITTPTDSSASRWFYLMPRHGSWWIWAVTAILLAVGLLGYPKAYWATLALTVTQLLVFWIRERSLRAFPVQLRLAFTILLCVCLLPSMRWLFWLPMIGTFAMLVFGYCLLARTLYLLPWNREEPVTLDMLQRTFFSPPKLPSREIAPTSGCAGGVCSIEAQVKMRRLPERASPPGNDRSHAAATIDDSLPE
jgi:hypothetical protein